MNKTLIELMLEANVEWPEGAEFAAQDKKSKKVYFFTVKPKCQASCGRWHDAGVIFDSGVELPVLCRNWHQTIVTREQYEDARGERNVELPTTWGETNKTIEQKIKDMVFHQESIARYQEQIEANHAVVDKLRTEIAADLAALGWGERVVEPELVITDWRDLWEGDIIECIGESWPDELINRLATVEMIDTNDDELGVLAYYKNIRHWGREFKFISRPSK